MTAPPLVDRTVVGALFEQIGADAARAVLALFVGDVEDQRAAIAAVAADARDGAARERARRAAHSLKGAAGQIGAAALSLAADAVERAADQDGAELAEASAALDRCAAETAVALAPYLT